MTHTTARTRRRSGAFYAAYLLLVGCGGAYALFVAYRAHADYVFLKEPHKGFSGRLYRADPLMGWAPLPGGRGEIVFRSSPPLPVHFDDDGFRVPATETDRPLRRRPLVLALGCSFTFGDACRAEDAFPYKLAARLQGTALNAGLCGGSLAQVLILARRLIPRFRPDYVVVQHSPWLLARGSSGFGKSSFGAVTAPLFYWNDAALQILPPLPGSVVFDLPLHDFDNARRGAAEYGSFLFRAGGPLVVHDDWLRLRFRALRWMGRMPPAADKPAQVLPLVYAEIASLCRQNGARMVVVRLSHPLDTRRIYLPRLEHAPGVVLVEAQAELNALAPDLDSYDRRFRHWSANEPGALEDSHPNPAAHELIAAAIARALAPEIE